MKRITAFLLVLSLVLCVMPSGVFAVTTNAVTFTISADKSAVSPGDTVNFTLSVRQTGQMTALETYLVIPAGLTLVPGSLATANKSVLGWDDLDKSEEYLQITGFGAPYNGTEAVPIATFSCTVDTKASGNLSVGLDSSTYAVDESYVYLKEMGIVPAQLTVVVQVTGVKLNKNALSLKTGESETLVATIDPSNASNTNIAWKSDNDTIATVDNTGKVVAVKEGTATITITTADGNFTDTCVVTVECSHANITPVSAKDSDCKNQGWDAYVKCEDCGQLFKADGTTEITEIPFRPLSSNHTGGNATCTVQAICSVCNQSYGSTLDHNYTDANKKAEALKSTGNCRDKSVYYYSCDACGKVENNDNHTFEGDKVSGTHVGGSHIEGASEPDHKNQVAGSTGATICNGCGATLSPATPIEPDAHIPASVWSNDETDHWKECNVVGCGVVIDGSKTPHSSEKAENKATCQKQAVCDVCGVSYGEVASHNYTAEDKKQDALVTAGNCRDKAVYYYSCSMCGLVENNDNHTFLGDKVATNHVGGTTTVDASEPDHKTQTDGYTGDTKCLGCGVTTAYGQTIPACAHTPANTWTTDGTHHWKVCTVANCGIIIEDTKAEHTATGANVATCKTQAICDICEKAHGSLDKNNHAGGTTTVDASEPDHKTQTDGYTGDTKCLGCGETIGYGQPITPDAHTPASVWSNDETDHWKECSVVGCGVVIDGSKATHTSTGANVATCQKQAVCDICGISYGTVAAHDFATTLSKDATGHWYACQTTGCTEKNEFAQHTPDHDGGATEEYPIKCTVCQYEMEAQLGHTHVFDKEVAEEQYLASKANCTDPAKYYKSCKCGEKGEETFASGEKLGHTEGTAWEKDATGHWHICTVAGCGVIIDTSKAEHAPDRETATETDPIKCAVCGYEIAPVLTHTHAYGAEWKHDTDNHWNECVCGDKANTAAHLDANSDCKCDTCEYVVSVSDNDNPQTGDNSMISLWIILLCVSGLGIVVTTVCRKKRTF